MTDHLTLKEIVERFLLDALGERCADPYSPMCAKCVAWDHFDNWRPPDEPPAQSSKTQSVGRTIEAACMVRETRNPGAGDLKELPEPQTEMKPLVRRSFVLFTDGRQPPIDRLSVMMTVLGEMDDNERHAALAYVADYYGYGIRVK